MAALSASRLVWSAISLITATMAPICCELSPSLATRSVALLTEPWMRSIPWMLCWALFTPWRAMSPASLALVAAVEDFSLISPMVPARCCMELLISSRRAACSSTLLWISSTWARMLLVSCRTWLLSWAVRPISSRRVAAMSLKLLMMTPMVSLLWMLQMKERSLLAMALATCEMRLSLDTSTRFIT